MRNRLQNLYSIFVLLGVLVTAFFLMDKTQSDYVRTRIAQENNYRAEAAAADPALSGLFAIESELIDSTNNNPSRTPSDIHRPRLRIYKPRFSAPSTRAHQPRSSNQY